MWTVAFVVVVLVVVVVAVALVRRPRGSDGHSVRNYNQALGTLEHLSERDRATHRAPDPGAFPRIVRAARRNAVVPPVPVRGTDEFPDPDAPIVFDDARPVERGRPGGEPTTPARADRAQRMALDSMNHRRRPGTGILVAIVVLIVFGVLAVVGSQKSRPPSHVTTTTTTRQSHAGGATTTTKPKLDPHHPTHADHACPPSSWRPRHRPRDLGHLHDPPHQLPDHRHRDRAPAGSRSPRRRPARPSGPVSCRPATVQNVQATGTTTVQFGTPTLTLEVDTIPVVLPTPLRTPFVATFTPSAAATAAAPSAPSTTTSTSSTGTSTTGPRPRPRPPALPQAAPDPAAGPAAQSGPGIQWGRTGASASPSASRMNA